MRRIIFIAAALGAAACAGLKTTEKRSVSERPDAALQRAIEEAVKGFHGDVGVYVRRLSDGRSAALKSDEAFPTASLVKVPILLALFDKIDRGQLNYNQSLAYHPTARDPGDDLLGAFKDGAKIDLNRIIMLMLTVSDNTAALWCQELAGGGAAVNDWLEANGFKATHVNTNTAGREAEKAQFGWGQTTPREMAELLVMIRQGRAVSPAASEEMLRALSRSFFDTEALSRIPPTVHAASKQGAVDHSRSEVLLVNAPSGDYVLSIITKNQADASWERLNEGYELLRKVSRVVWERFEGANWQPAPEMERYFKA